jgi:hypothetical protein
LIELRILRRKAIQVDANVEQSQPMSLLAVKAESSLFVLIKVGPVRHHLLGIFI